MELVAFQLTISHLSLKTPIHMVHQLDLLNCQTDSKN